MDDVGFVFFNWLDVKIIIKRGILFIDFICNVIKGGLLLKRFLLFVKFIWILLFLILILYWWLDGCYVFGILFSLFGMMVVVFEWNNFGRNGEYYVLVVLKKV